MTPSRDKKKEEAGLWRRFADAAGDAEGGPDVDANLLAAYLDGTATPDEVEAVERAMAADPDLVEAVGELRDLQDAEPVELSEAALARIKMIVSAKGRPRLGWVRRVAAVAALVAVSFAGYELGGYSAYAAAETDAIAVSQLAAQWEDQLIADVMLVAADGDDND